MYSYVEVNFMKNATIPYTVIDDIIPSLNPVPDYISVSTTTLAAAVRDINPAQKLHPLLDHVRGRLPSKAGLQEPRVFVGECALILLILLRSVCLLLHKLSCS